MHIFGRPSCELTEGQWVYIYAMTLAQREIESRDPETDSPYAAAEEIIEIEDNG